MNDGGQLTGSVSGAANPPPAFRVAARTTEAGSPSGRQPPDRSDTCARPDREIGGMDGLAGRRDRLGRGEPVLRPQARHHEGRYLALAARPGDQSSPGGVERRMDLPLRAGEQRAARAVGVEAHVGPAAPRGRTAASKASGRAGLVLVDRRPGEEHPAALSIAARSTLGV